MEKPRQKPRANASYYYPDVSVSAKACVSWGCSSQFFLPPITQPMKEETALPAGLGTPLLHLLCPDHSGNSPRVLPFLLLPPPTYIVAPRSGPFEPPCSTSLLGRFSGMEGRGFPSSSDPVWLRGHRDSQAHTHRTSQHFLTV